MEEHTQDAAAEEEATRLPVCDLMCPYSIIISLKATQVKIAIYASLIANFALCVIQRKWHNAESEPHHLKHLLNFG